MEVESTKPVNDKRLKCKFCTYTTVKGYKDKLGKFHGVDSAHQRLLVHVQLEHPEEYDRITSEMKEWTGGEDAV